MKEKLKDIVQSIDTCAEKRKGTRIVVVARVHCLYNGQDKTFWFTKGLVNAKRFDIPFYVAAPYSTFDMDININDTVIEERDPDEVIHYGSCRICPKGTEVINPAFDIVPNDLITGIITEKGIIDPL